MATNAYVLDEFVEMFRRNAGYIYRMALCHGGTAAQAEQILGDALWNVYRRHGVIRKRAAFRSVVVQAMEFRPEGDRWMHLEGLVSPAGIAFSEMDTALKRALVLHYEEQWPERDAARGCGISSAMLAQAIRRLESMQGGQDFPDELHASLMQGSAPDTGRIIRSFTDRAAGWKRPSRWGRRVAKILFSTALILILCAIFWLAAVILEG